MNPQLVRYLLAIAHKKVVTRSNIPATRSDGVVNNKEITITSVSSSDFSCFSKEKSMKLYRELQL